jgi:hypothetical protein
MILEQRPVQSIGPSPKKKKKLIIQSIKNINQDGLEIDKTYAYKLIDPLSLLCFQLTIIRHLQTKTSLRLPLTQQKIMIARQQKFMNIMQMCSRCIKPLV